jgi:hypothetical protein
MTEALERGKTFPPIVVVEMAFVAENIGAMPERRPGMKIHWAWVPAALFSVGVGVARWGLLTTLVLVAGGLLLAAYAEWRARKRKGSRER